MKLNKTKAAWRGASGLVGVALFVATLVSCGLPESATPTVSESISANAQEESTMIVSVNGEDLQLELSENSSARALADLVGEDGLQLTMEDYGGFEKVGRLPQQLPTNDEQLTTQPGDVILYQGDKLTIYYDTSSWNLTRIGRITGVSAEQLRQLLGVGEVHVTLRHS